MYHKNSQTWTYLNDFIEPQKENYRQTILTVSLYPVELDIFCDRKILPVVKEFSREESSDHSEAVDGRLVIGPILAAFVCSFFFLFFFECFSSSLPKRKFLPLLSIMSR